MQKSTPTQSEASIQQSIVQWYRNTYCLKHHNPRSMIFSIPNESNGSRAMKLIQTGLYPGAGDFVVCHLRGAGIVQRWIFIEVKTGIGTQKPNQKEFEEHCKIMGIPYFIVRSLEDFKQVINNI